MVIIGGLFHIFVRPPENLYRGLRMGNIESVLASSLAVFFCAGFNRLRHHVVRHRHHPHRTGGDPPAISGIEAYFQKEINRRVFFLPWMRAKSLSEAWSEIPEKTGLL